ncbi:MAG: type II secretion system protein GspL [Janthinobacterium lividum]
MKTRTKASRARPAGVWTLVKGAPVALDRCADGPAILLVPTEDVLLLVVDLPPSSPAKRAAAAAIAIEQRLSEPLDAVHVAVGAASAPHRHLVGVVRRALLQSWIAALERVDLSHAAIVPDVLFLPVPPAGSWSIEATGGRVLARTDTGAGFAVRDELFPLFWKRSGQPTCVVYGNELPAGLPAIAGAVASVFRAREESNVLDLRQGGYACRNRLVSPLLRRFGTIFATGLAGHTAIAGADALDLRADARAIHTQVENLRRQELPSVPADLLEASLLKPARADHFLPLLSRVANVLQTRSGWTASALSYRANSSALTLSLAPLKKIESDREIAALKAAGLRPELRRRGDPHEATGPSITVFGVAE